jgi:hypothetical protein
LINGSYSGIIEYYLTNSKISYNTIIGGTIYGIGLIGMTNAIISNNDIISFYICGISLNGATNILFYNNRNGIENFEMTIPKFCMGEYESSINSLSTYNLGWFPRDYNSVLITNLNENSYYNISKSYNVIYEDPNYIMIANKSKSYFIYPVCQQNWIKQVEPCINSVSLINYIDENDCELYSNLPINNNTNENCQSTIALKLDISLWIPTIFFTLILAFIILGIWFPPSLIVAGILCQLFAFIGKQYFPLETQTILFWIFIGLGIALIPIGLLIFIKWTSE